jgi:hypothetical protein
MWWWIPSKYFLAQKKRRRKFLCFSSKYQNLNNGILSAKHAKMDH